MAKALGPGDDLEMMKSPDRWPCWPYLPLKKYEDKGSWPICGYLFDGGGPNIYRGNIHRPDPQGDKAEGFASFEAIVAAGWEVD